MVNFGQKKITLFAVREPDASTENRMAGIFSYLQGSSGNRGKFNRFHIFDCVFLLASFYIEKPTPPNILNRD
ncbi:MAG: hypothetical protein A3I66_21025 [Burkholderiales bacterium RIFCSPLOWO2_02_FULL_57_36]|nr:MAG: hypothetical protein A3I66_21025 [Burkholderiales bacterium RIFCSPLOWO2_02_FULL_57_36]